MVAEIAETKWNQQHVMPIFIKAQRVTAGDWIVVNGFKGVLPLQGIGQSTAVSLSDTFTYGVATITPTCTTTTTSIAVTLGTVTRVPPFYVLTAGGEILEVTSETDSTAAGSTWTCRRGCLGTTASATGLAATNIVAILNIVFMGANNVGPNLIVALPLPNDARAQLFA
jgi:hypothetical protein